MAMSEEIPQWALDRVVQEIGSASRLIDDEVIAHAFARYIAQHEQPPVDPVMEIFHGITRDDEAMDRHYQAGMIEAIRRLDERGMIDRKRKEAGK